MLALAQTKPPKPKKSLTSSHDDKTILQRQRIEWLKCSMSMNYWLATYAYIFNATDGDWVQFELWPSQSETLQRLASEAQSVVLKARQLGLTWLVLCYALYLMLFRPAATVLIFSKRDEEATELLKRIKGVYARLPVWMQA